MTDTARRLPESAHRPLREGETYVPYVPAHDAPAEFTVKALFFGVLFGILFGAANAYLGLRAGLDSFFSPVLSRHFWMGSSLKSVY